MNRHQIEINEHLKTNEEENLAAKIEEINSLINNNMQEDTT